MHYHGTPISPVAALHELAGCHFCVSYSQPQDIRRAHAVGQSVMLDNGAFSKWKRNEATDWPAYYAWAEEWLAYPTTWAVIPDVIDGGSQVQDALLREWPFGHRGAPVWHMDEPLPRLLRLVDEWPRVCIGSTAEFRMVLSDPWERRMDEIFNAVGNRRFLPWLHMLRGMQCVGLRWPFASVDSTDVGRNHNRAHNAPGKMARRWDAVQCGGRWVRRPEQLELVP
jgi:hypothetical protein